jgi:transcription factor TFIIIB component B''
MQTLSRMTGKDFSGPVPEIRVPAPRPAVRVEDGETSADNPNETTSAGDAGKKGKRSRGRNVAAEDGVIIVGHVESDHDS